jgi:hypothetical protein
MRTLLTNCWRDDCGALIATEFLFLATILGIGTVVGLASVRDAVNTELHELANTILSLSQGFTISGVTGCGAFVDGTAVVDVPELQPCLARTTPTVPTLLGCDTPCP